ncbi:MAG: T9SS type A sorting domain-containing protein [Bacteroidota bacterium]
MKKIKPCILMFAAIFMLAGNINAQTTRLGLRAGTNPTLLSFYSDLGAEVSRQIIFDHHITLQNLNAFRSDLQLFKNSGIVTIVCLRFPTDTLDSNQADRIPLFDNTDLNTSLQKVGMLLDSLDGVLDYIQIQNEPLSGPGKLVNISDASHYGYFAIQWLDTLGSFIRQRIDDNNLDIKVISAGFHDVSQALHNDTVYNSFKYIYAPGDTVYPGNTDRPLSRFWYRNLLEISKPYCDLIDIHVNVKNISDVHNYISALDSLQTKINPVSLIIPLTTLEWSQAKEKNSLINANLWMQQFLDSAYTYQVNQQDWYNFIDSLDYDTTFMQQAFDIFCQNNFAHACYAGLLQFGTDLSQQIFSTVALLTNKVTGINDQNQPFYNLYKNIRECDTTTTIIKSFVSDEGNCIIYPNPATNIITIEFLKSITEQIELEIFNIFGQLVYAKNISHNNGASTHHISQLGTGIYVVRITSDNQKLYDKKLIITK